MTADWVGAVAGIVAAIAGIVAAVMAALAYFAPRRDPKATKSPTPAMRRRRRMLLSISALGVVVAGGAAYVHFHPTKKGKSSMTVHEPAAPPGPTQAEQQAAIQQREAEARSKQARLAAQTRLHHLIRHNLVQEAIKCTVNESLPEHMVAQQVCRKGGATIVYTRLDTEAATHSYWLDRYENSSNFVGYVENCRGPYWPPYSWWNNFQGHNEGSFAFRVSGSDIILIWEIRHLRVVIRESQADDADYLCKLWGEQSGKYLSSTQ